MYKLMAAILDLTWLPWLQANTHIVNKFINPILLNLETFLVTLALILIFFRTISSKYENKAIIEEPNEYTSTRDLVLAKTHIISQCACAAANTSHFLPPWLNHTF